MVDETTDRKSQKVVNVLVGILSSVPMEPMLLHIDILAAANKETIIQTILEACKILWPTSQKYDKLELIVSDGAAYMRKAIRGLKANNLMFPNLKHITCILHGIILVVKDIEAQFPLVNQLLVDVKKYFTNASSRVKHFKATTELNLPPKPIAIRWCTWLKSAQYQLKHYSEMKGYFETVPAPASSDLIVEIIKLYDFSELTKQLMELSPYLKFIQIMTSLESLNMILADQLCRLGEVFEIVKDTPFSSRFKQILSDNPDLDFYTADQLPDVEMRRKYAPLTSVEVERSFSKYRAFYRDNRMKLTESNLKKMFFVYCNNNL
ncbi:hypothetical protein HDE_01070 [Halotydeus destructor]|nr:hypothetical protein HDE_01070 [Halotydeus destructor]